jgi:pimeloyl-ACP methyl ester carboxylesterase
VSSRLLPKRFDGRDGAPLAYREVGDGRPLVLLHGYFSTATVNWVTYGHAERLAAAGHRVLMPDLRAHGDSATSHDPSDYPPDVLTEDGLALIDHLGLTDYDLGGYSLGGRTVLGMLVRGATPRRAVVAGVGLDDLVHATSRGGYYRDILTHLGTFERRSPQWQAERFLRSTGGDPVALLRLLDSWVDTPADALVAITAPILVLVGADDERADGARELAAALAAATFVTVPGDHMSAVANPGLGEQLAAFLG